MDLCSLPLKNSESWIVLLGLRSSLPQAPSHAHYFVDVSVSQALYTGSMELRSSPCEARWAWLSRRQNFQTMDKGVASNSSKSCEDCALPCNTILNCFIRLMDLFGSLSLENSWIMIAIWDSGRASHKHQAMPALLLGVPVRHTISSR